MILKIFNLIFKHKLVSIILLLVIIGGYFGFQKLTDKGTETRYVVAAVEKGTIVSSVSGSGQVVVWDQIDIKPKVSGELAALYLTQDQAVKTGQLLAVLDSSDAEKAVRDARSALDDAKYALTQAQKDYKDIETEAERTLTSAYENGYNTVSTVFFKLSGYMQDLKNVLGTEESTQEYITGYELILGRNSLFIQKILDDYNSALELFNKNFVFFRTVFRDDDRDTIYQLINDTLETTKAISQALDSARHMYDAISLNNYAHFRVIASHIDEMQPQIESDVSAIYSNTNSLQTIKDTINDTNENTPEKIEDAERAIQSAQNTIVKKEEALADAKKDLTECSISAPFGGIIAEVGDVKKGDTVSTNTVLATLITKQKIVEITLNEVDAAKVKVGQKATLTFDALPDITVAGKVFEVDLMGTVSQGVVSYGVKISFDTAEEKIKAGMSVTADIITEAKTDVLVVPNGAIKSQGNVYYVELVETTTETATQQLLANVSGVILSASPKTQTVEVGLSNDLYTEIVSGLKEGDIVVSSTITQNKTQTTQTGTTQTRSIQGFGVPGGEVQMFIR